MDKITSAWKKREEDQSTSNRGGFFYGLVSEARSSSFGGRTMWWEPSSFSGCVALIANMRGTKLMPYR